MSEFKVGQKVKIREGGWGMHPIHEGKIVTIHSITAGGRYTTEESLSDVGGFSVHAGRSTSVDGRTFEAIEAKELTTVEQIEAVNQQIRDVNSSIQRLNTSLVSENAAKEALNRQRNQLLATLMQDLQP